MGQTSGQEVELKAGGKVSFEPDMDRMWHHFLFFPCCFQFRLMWSSCRLTEREPEGSQTNTDVPADVSDQTSELTHLRRNVNATERLLDRMNTGTPSVSTDVTEPEISVKIIQLSFREAADSPFTERQKTQRSFKISLVHLKLLMN